MTWYGPLCAFGSSVTWALGSSLYARLSRAHSPFAVNFTRALLALPFFALAALVTHADWATIRPEHLGWFALSALASYGLGDTIFLGSARMIGVPAALAIASTYPIWSAALGWSVLGEKLEPRQALGLVLCIAGVAGVILSERKIEGSKFSWYGVGLAALTSVFWCLNSASVAHGGRTLDPALANLIRMGCALGMSAAFGKVARGPSHATQGFQVYLPWHVVRSTVWLFVLEAFGGSYLFLVGLSHSSMAVGSTLSSLAPVLAVPIAVLQGAEAFSWRKTLWITGVVAGLALLVY